MSITEKLLSTPKLWERENDIIQWGVDRNIIGDNAQATFESQQEKTRQEWEEWKRDHSMDDCGDIFVTLVMQAALKGVTVSSILQKCIEDFPRFINTHYDTLIENCEENLEVSLKNLLNINSIFDINLCYTLIDLYLVCEKYGWTLEECIEVAWSDIKDRKGKMMYGMFVKQKDLDALSELGVEVVEGDGEVFFEGVGSKMTYNDFTSAEELFDKLSLKFNFFEGMKYLRTTGRI